MRVAAVIPVYNEEKTIEFLVKRTLKFVDKVVVVDDGSSDASAARARAAGAQVISLGKNTGKANALRQGFKEVQGYDVVVTLDGDLQHSPSEIPGLIECIRRGSDLCIGSRFLSGNESMPLQRRLSNKVTSWIISILARQRITDPQSGFRAIRGDKLAQLELRAERYAIEHVMILEAARKGFRIGEVPISTIYGEEKSYIHPVKDTLRVIYYIMRFLVRG
jgi:glycosyltransferase involved in cell wall biosynthesis